MEKSNEGGDFISKNYDKNYIDFDKSKSRAVKSEASKFSHKKLIRKANMFLKVFVFFCKFQPKKTMNHQQWRKPMLQATKILNRKLKKRQLKQKTYLKVYII